MTTPRKPEDLTIDEIKEQMALYQRLYYYKVRDNPEFGEKRKETQRRYYEKKKAKLEEQRKLEEGTTSEEAKDKKKPQREYMRKYTKDVNEAMLIVYKMAND